MSTFALTNSSKPDLLLDAVNYAISNLGQGTGNVGPQGNTLVVNTTTGQIINSTTGDVYGYLYQYITVRYADSSDGLLNFSTLPTNRFYFGVNNSTTGAPGATPADYQWYQVTGGFGTTKKLYYSTLGGRQIQFAASQTPINSSFIESPITAIDLDIITAVNSATIVTQQVFQRNASTPSTPTGGSYDFSTAQLLAPFGWFASIPSGTSPIWSSQNTFVSEFGNTVVPPNGPWTTPVEVAQNGEDAQSIFTVVAYTRLATPPATPTANTGSWNFSTNTGTPPTGAQTWSLTPPAGNIQLYGSQAVASIVGSQGTDNTLTWSTPYQVSQAGAAGADGISIYFYTVFQQTTNQPATPSGGSFNFGTATGTPPVGWSNNPPSGNVIVWASSAQATNPGPIGIWTGGNTWSTPVQYTGTTGAAGRNGFTAASNPSIISYPMETNGTWTPQSTPILTTFTDGTTTDNVTVFGNVSANGQISYGYGNSNPNISIIGPTTVSTNPQSVRIGFRHIPSDSTSTAITSTAIYPYTQNAALGGTNVIIGGNTVAVIASSPNFNLNYSNGQFFTQFANGVYNPPAVANVVKTTANIVVNRGNVLVGYVARDIQYNINTRLWSTGPNNIPGNLNPQYFSFGAPQVSNASFFSSLLYVDPIGSVSNNLAVSVIQPGQNGNAGPQGNRGFVPLGYVITPSSPLSAGQPQFTAWFSAPREASIPPIGTGYTPISGDTAMFTWVDTANATTVQLLKTYSSGNLWLDANAQVIPGNVIVTGSVTAGKLAANDVYALTIRGGNVTPGVFSGLGYWAQANTGNAYFGGNIRIGNSASVGNNFSVGNNARIGDSLTIGNNLTIGANLTLGANLTIGQNLRVGNNANIGNSLTIANFANIGTFATIGSNLIVGQSAAIGNNLSVGNNARIGDSLTIGNNLTIGANLTLGANLTIGDSLRVGNNANIGNNLTVGNNANIGANLRIGNNVIINANAFIGNNSFIGNNLNIGANLLVGAGANIGNSLTIGNNAIIGNNLIVGNSAFIGANLTVQGLVTAGSLNANVVGPAQLQPGAIPNTNTGEVTILFGSATLTNNSATWDPGPGVVGYEKVLAYCKTAYNAAWLNTPFPTFNITVSFQIFAPTGYTGSPLYVQTWINRPSGTTANQTKIVNGTTALRTDIPLPFSGSYNGFYNYATNLTLGGSTNWSPNFPTIWGVSIYAGTGISNFGSTGVTISQIQLIVQLAP